MSLRILHVLQQVDSDAGRSAEAVCELSTGQRQFGHVVEIALIGKSSGNRFDHLGIPIHHLNAGRAGYAFDSGFVPWLKQRTTNFDCVIVHGIWDYCGLGTMRALEDSPVPYFVFTHGMLDPWNKLSRPFRHILRWLYWPWGAYPVLRDAHAVFFLCEDERHRAREAFWLYDCHEFVVRFGTQGISQEYALGAGRRFNEAHPELEGKRLFTLIADEGYLEGVESVIGAVGSLMQKGQWDATTMRLVIVGLPNAVEEALVRGIAERNGIGNCVFSMAGNAKQKTWDTLQASEVFLRPSSYEICGIRVADALSVGTPVLMSNGVAIWKDIVNDEAGYADDLTPEGMARLLKRWIDLSREEREGFRKRAKKCFDGRYTLDGAAHTLTSAIYLLVGVHRDGRWDFKPLKPGSELA